MEADLVTNQSPCNRGLRHAQCNVAPIEAVAIRIWPEFFHSGKRFFAADDGTGLMPSHVPIAHRPERVWRPTGCCWQGLPHRHPNNGWAAEGSVPGEHFPTVADGSARNPDPGAEGCSKPGFTSGQNPLCCPPCTRSAPSSSEFCCSQPSGC